MSSAARARWRTGLLALALLLVLIAAGIWLARKPIADDFIQRELARRGVPARYSVEKIGFRTQRLENVRIGDPANPDLVARAIEVDLVPTFGAPRVREVRAEGVRLKGRIEGGALRLGALEKLLPPPSGKPFALPDLMLRVTDGRMALATPLGTVALVLDGAGNLQSGFTGRLSAASREIVAGDCRIITPRARLRVAVTGSRPRFEGPVAADHVRCGAAGVTTLTGKIDATLAPGLDGWRGFAQIASGAGDASGFTARQLRAQVDFAGDPRRTDGMARIAGFDVSGAPGRARRVELTGRYSIGDRIADTMPGDPRGLHETGWRFEGGASAAGLVPAQGLPALGGAAGTPLEPFVAALDRALGAARSGLDARASLVAAQAGESGSLRIERGEVSGGGVRLVLAGGEGARLVWPGPGPWQVDGRLALTGPGLPRTVAELRQRAPGAPLVGIARMDPWVAGAARLELAPVRFAGGRFDTRMVLSGPLLGGRVEGLALPLTGRFGGGGLVLNPGCTPLAFERLELSGLRLEPARLRLCGDGAGLLANGRAAGRVVAPRLAGTLGQSPIAIAADGVRFVDTRFTVDGLAVRLGDADRLSRLDVQRLDGAAGDGVGGRYSGAAGEIGKVPLRIFDAAGRWRLRGGTLDLAGDIRVADTANPPRFNPLVASDFTLRLADNTIVAGGRLAEPRSGVEVTRVALRHNLSRGDGAATLDVPGLRFDKRLQPEAITRLTLGVVANVDGRLSGQGRIAWSPEAVTSDGLFRVRAESLAAAFGPVSGLDGEIRFTDLLGLVTAPGQVMTVEGINPGVLVENGVVRYQLIPDLRVEVLSGEWPFAGGRLTLRPTILDFSADAARRMTFDVEALDAAQFISKLEVKNLDATGIFDGTLPMVFDADGGRIVDGGLRARPPGGRLAYVGEVSNADLGIWGDIAFDALKSISYRNMTIDLDGEIDGEMVSQIRFEGISRGTIQPVATGLIARVGGQLANQLQQLPFRFNIQVRAPFRGLISTARSFYDPGFLVRDRLPAGFEPAAEPADAPVQPPASRNER